MDDSYFSENLTKVRGPLLDVAGVDVLRLYGDLLDAAVKRERPSSDSDLYWSVWRPWIGGSRERGDRRDELLNAIRDDAVRLAQKDATTLKRVFDVLMERGGVHERVAHFVLGQFANVSPDLTRRAIGNGKRWRSRHLTREFAFLIQQGAVLLTPTGLDRIFRWIDQGPPAKDDDDDRFIRAWRYRHLQPLEAVLPPRRREVLAQMQSEFGPLESPTEYSPVTASFVGPTSPVTAADIGRESADAIAQRLRSWIPTPGWAQATPEGLGRELAKAVEERPTLAKELEEHAATLHPTYVRAILDGLRTAVRNGGTIDWDSALRIASFVTSARGDVPVLSEDDFDADRDWRNARRSAGWIFLAALEQDAVGSATAEGVWAGISELISDPEPDADYERRYGHTNMDWSTVAINTIRPLAVIAAIQFSRVAANLHLDEAAVRRVFTALDAHLDESTDPSLAVRAVFGQMYPRLMDWAPAWTSERTGRIFPVKDLDSSRWWSAWSALLAFNRPTPYLYATLNADYEAAILRVENAPDWRFPVDPVERLAEHLVIGIAQGWIDLDSSLMKLAAGVEPPALWTAILSFAGRVVTNEELHDEQLQRLQRLWETRRQRRDKGAGSESEIAEFGWWFMSPHLPEAWQIENLLWVLSQTVLDRGSAWGVMERLANLVEYDPARVLACVALLVDNPGDDWRVHSWRSELKKILEVTEGMAIPDVQRRREEVKSRLAMKWGLLEFLPNADTTEEPAP